MADSYVSAAGVHNPSAGVDIDEGWAATINANLDFLHNPPAAKVRLDTAQAITNATDEYLSWGVADFDNGALYGGALWDSGDATKLTVPTATTGSNAGRYLACAYIYWGSELGAASEFRYARIIDGASTVVARESHSAVTYGRFCIVSEVVLSEGDYLRVQVKHDISTGDADVRAGSYLALVYLGVA